jgi:methyl-accepting chemotaxis protein
MVLPFKLGRLRRPKTSTGASDRKSRLGLRGSLLLAFMAIAATSIVIAAGASLLLGQLSGMNQALTEQDVPRLTTAMQLSELSESLAANGPTLLNAPTEQMREQQLKALKETQASALARLSDLSKLGTDPKIVTALEENLKNIAGMTDNLDSAARQRLETFANREKQLDALNSAHKGFLGVIESAITEARSDLNSAVMTEGALKEALAAVRMADTLAILMADSNLVAGALSAAAAATRGKAIDEAEKTYKATRKRMTENVEVVRELFSAPLIKETSSKLLALGEGRDSIIELRRKELQIVDAGQSILDDTHRFNSFLAMGVKDLVASVQTTTALTSEKALSLTSFAILVMIGMGAAAFVGSLLFVWLYVGRNILRRIGNLQTVMQRLAQGDLAAEVTASRTRDEIAEMAASLEVFRESMIQSKTLAAEQDKDRAAKTERTARMEARIANFEQTVRSALDTLMGSANAMQATAEAMSGSADRSSALASAVASAAEETSVNVQTVSSGTEELSSSIAEISRQVSSSTQVANKAVSEASATDATMQGLAESASRISTVVDLIQTIASQTNLLALNATIEAARAGESGRGFAVVASEVKSLADQTAKATDEIRGQIVSMQDVTTNAVGAIRHIGQTIAEINEVTTAIAAAVEEQGAATREIARNIQHAASGTSEVSSNIVGVSQASSEAGTSAADVLTASGALRKEAETLRNEIDTFLSQIRAA